MCEDAKLLTFLPLWAVTLQMLVLFRRSRSLKLQQLSQQFLRTEISSVGLGNLLETLSHFEGFSSTRESVRSNVHTVNIISQENNKYASIASIGIKKAGSSLVLLDKDHFLCLRA